MSDDKKLTLSSSTLGVSKGADASTVKQNFSGGRGKSVVVERKKKRTLTMGGSVSGKPKTASPDANAFVVKKPASESKKAKTSASGKTLSSAEQATRMAALDAFRKDEEVKKLKETEFAAEAEERKAKEDAEKAKLEATAAAAAEIAAAEDAEKQANKSPEEVAEEAASEDARKLAEEAAKKASEAKARKIAEAEAQKQLDIDEKAVELRKAEEARKIADAQLATSKAEEDKGHHRKKGKAKTSKATQDQQQKTARNAQQRRRSGKLSVTMNFDDDNVRTRSMAAYKRAQAKIKRAQSGEVEQKTREVIIPEVITVQELANRMAEKARDVFKVLKTLEVEFEDRESELDQDTAQLVVEEFGHSAQRVLESDIEIGLMGEEDSDENMTPRAPIITIMGHVDHGKTSLLDALRKTDVVAGEAGGITQHIGAYQIKNEAGELVTFLDTPGHAAFTHMRARGASVTDIVILVVAADDGIMPQTIEAINHAKAAEVPIIVAINKIDAPGADADKVRQELLQHEVVVEAFQGDTMDVEVSALKGTNLDKLAEAISLQAEILELKANANRDAEGVVIEAKLEKGRGPVATLLIQRGTLKVGDIFVAGTEWGKVRAIINDHGERIKEAGPSQPVEVLGLSGAPNAGDDFGSVVGESRAREITEYRQNVAKKKIVEAAGPKTLENMFAKLKESEMETFPIVLKADVQGSVEAIVAALSKVGSDDIKTHILHAAAGGITEADITLANASGALVIGFNVRPNSAAKRVATQDGVTIKYYSVIYDVINDVRAAMSGQLGPEYEENVLGRAEIKDVFSAGKTGKAAGCIVTDGHIRNDLKARILRDDVIIYTGQIDNLRRFKDDVKKVDSGQECGLTFENFSDMKSGDFLEVYELNEIERKMN